MIRAVEMSCNEQSLILTDSFTKFETSFVGFLGSWREEIYAEEHNVQRYSSQEVKSLLCNLYVDEKSSSHTFIVHIKDTTYIFIESTRISKMFDGMNGTGKKMWEKMSPPEGPVEF